MWQILFLCCIVFLFELDLLGKKIMEILSMPPGKYLNKIYIDLENRIIDGLLVNDNKNIESYIINNYRG